MPSAPVLLHRAPGREIDAQACAGRSRDLDSAHRRLANGLAQERVAGDEEVVAAFEPRRIQLVRPEVGSIASVRQHRALARRVDERADDPSPPSDRAGELDAPPLEPVRGERAGLVGATLADEARTRAELGGPGGDVRGLPARPDVRQGRCVRSTCDRPVDPDDDVEREIPEGADEHEEDRKI